MRYQLRHAPRLRGRLYRRPATSIQTVPLAALFSTITVAFAAIALYSATSGEWVIAAAAAALAGWMATFAYAALRKTRS